MKKIYLALLALTLGVSAQAQRTLKLTLTIKSPIIDTNITSTSTIRPSYVIKNVSATAADSICKGDTIIFRTPANTLTGTTSRSGIVFGGTIKRGDSIILNKSTITGSGTDYEMTFSQIETLLNLTADTVKVKPFTNNKKYHWYFQVTYYGGATGSPAFGTGGVTVTNANNADTQIVWINKSGTAISELAAENNVIKTYPNPAVNQLSFDLDITANDKATATVMDAAGRTVLVKELDNTNNKHDLDISTISTGMYMLRVNVGDKVNISKFNVQK